MDPNQAKHNDIERNWGRLRRTVWAADLKIALMTAIAVFVGWLTLPHKAITLDDLWKIAPVSFAIAVYIWNMSRTWTSSLANSDLGELLRIGDRDESEVMLPFQIGGWVAIASFVWSSVIGVIVEGISNVVVQGIVVAVTAFLFVWSCAAAFMLMRIVSTLDRQAAHLRSRREDAQFWLRQAQEEAAKSPIRKPREKRRVAHKEA